MTQPTLLQARFIYAAAGSTAGRMNSFFYVTFCASIFYFFLEESANLAFGRFHDTKSNQKSQDWTFLLKNPKFLFRKFTNLRENLIGWIIADCCRASNSVNFSVVIIYTVENEEIYGFS